MTTKEQEREHTMIILEYRGYRFDASGVSIETVKAWKTALDRKLDTLDALVDGNGSYDDALAASKAFDAATAALKAEHDAAYQPTPYTAPVFDFGRR